MDLCKRLLDLMEGYVGYTLTDRIIEELRLDLLAEADFKDVGFDCDISLARTVEDPSVLCVSLVVDCSFIRSISDLSQLPEYLTHELDSVREAASERLEELKAYAPVA